MKRTMQFADPSRSLAVVSSNTPWNEPPRIRHQVSRQLTREYNVLYVQLPFTSRSPKTTLEKITPSLIAVTLAGFNRITKRLCHEFEQLHSIAEALTTKQISRLVKAMGYQEATLVNFQHDFSKTMHEPLFRKKIYFCNDDFFGMAKSKRRKKRARYKEEATAKAANFCCAVSHPLKDRLSLISKDPLLVLPGHEFEIANNTNTFNAKEKDVIKACFMGYVNDRISFKWIREALCDNKIAFTLVGPVEDQELIRELKTYPKFTHLNTLTGKELQSCLSNQDVLTMPYDTSRAGPRATTAPNKLFQYLACGKPVVISDMPNFISLPKGFLYRANDSETFKEQIIRASKEDTKAYTIERLSYACKNSWDFRGDEILKRIRQLKPAPSAS